MQRARCRGPSIDTRSLDDNGRGSSESLAPSLPDNAIICRLFLVGYSLDSRLPGERQSSTRVCAHQDSDTPKAARWSNHACATSRGSVVPPVGPFLCVVTTESANCSFFTTQSREQRYVYDRIIGVKLSALGASVGSKFPRHFWKWETLCTLTMAELS